MDKTIKDMYEKLTWTAKGALADGFEVSLSTIRRWILEEDDRLTSDKAKRILKDNGVDFPQSIHA